MTVAQLGAVLGYGTVVVSTVVVLLRLSRTHEKRVNLAMVLLEMC